MKLDTRNLSPFIAEIIVKQFEELCTLLVHNSDRASQRSIQLMHQQSVHKVQQIKKLSPNRKGELLQRLRKALISFNNNSLKFRGEITEEQELMLGKVFSDFIKNKRSLDWFAPSIEFKSPKEVLEAYPDIKQLKQYYKEITGKETTIKSAETLAKKIYGIKS